MVTNYIAGQDGNGIQVVRAFFFDLDGTLLNSKHQIPALTLGYVVKANNQKGVRVIPVSGKPPAAIRPYMEEMGIRDQIAISHHGARVEHNGKVIGYHPMPEVNAHAAIDSLNAVEGLDGKVDLLVFRGDNTKFRDNRIEPTGLYSKRIEEYRTRNPALAYDPLSSKPTIEDYLRAGPIDKMIALVDTPELAQSLKSGLVDKLRGQHVRIMISNGTYVEFVDEDATKGSGVKDILNYLNVKPSNAIAFGDGESDISMATVGRVHLYLVGNAPEDVKERVGSLKSVTVLPHTNEQDAIGRVIAELILKEPYKA